MTAPVKLILTAAVLALAACAEPVPFPGGGPILVEPAPQGARPVQRIPAPRDGQPSDAVEARLLAAHNGERARVGVPALTWSDELEDEARVWARELAATGRFAHDPARHGHGENLWTGWGKIFSPEEMVGEWIAERANYRRGVFPNVSQTPNWTDVGHYTQLIWRSTTHVGCAVEVVGNRSVLACRYAPPGNVDGRSPE